MNAPPIVSPEAWEAARQQMLAKEKAAGDAVSAERRWMPGMAVENQTEVAPRPHAATVPGYQVGAASADTTADTRLGEMAQARRRVASDFEGPNGKVNPKALENHSRVLSRFLMLCCGGVAATLAWWWYGDAARWMIANSHTQLRWLAPPRAQTVPGAPDMIVPYPNQLDATLREPDTVPPSANRIVAGQKLSRNTDQTTTGVDQAPSAQADSIPVESRHDVPSLQPTVPVNTKPTEAKASPTLSEKGKQLSAANQQDASCFPSASAVLRNHPGARPTWTLRAPGHEGTQCWYAAERRR